MPPPPLPPNNQPQLLPCRRRHPYPLLPKTRSCCRKWRRSSALGKASAWNRPDLGAYAADASSSIPIKLPDTCAHWAAQGADSSQNLP